jgi:predicted transcriptional regulator
MMSEQAQGKGADPELLQMTAQVVASYVGNNTVASSQISEVIRTIFTTLNGLDGTDSIQNANGQKPAVAIKKSITPEYIVCLEDGKRLKMLKRHLRTSYNLSPDEYRTKWGLPSDYPIVAPNYARQRSAFAKKIGLGKRASGRRRGK